MRLPSLWFIVQYEVFKMKKIRYFAALAACFVFLVRESYWVSRTHDDAEIIMGGLLIIACLALALFKIYRYRAVVGQKKER